LFKKAVFVLAFSLCFQGLLLAEGNIKVGDRIIGSTFRTLAKGFVLAVDIEQLKKNNIDKLTAMKDEKFRRRYAEVYEIIQDLPTDLKNAYGIKKEMTRQEAIAEIKKMDKKKIYAIIDAVPDAVIVRQFKQYLAEQKRTLEESSAAEEINKFWQKVLKKIHAPETQKNSKDKI